MKRLLILAAATAFVVARPETYKEQEEFQYSRSSSDDGTKSGYYGAQRGNMGGNYERAHNMDSLAQNQMSGVVRQVHGDLGDGANTRTGSVYSAANSRGTYGSGHYDLSNLAGRNFQEGTSYYDNSQSRSSLTQSSNSNSHRYGGYHRLASDSHSQSDDLQSLTNSQRSSSLSSSSYGSQSGFQEQSQYNRDNADLQSSHTTVYRVPVRVFVRPGGRVSIPVQAQLYDGTQGSSVVNHNALDTETTNDNNQDSVYRPSNSNSRFYESSYRYNKKWENHDTAPTSISIVPTDSSIPRHSELYKDSNVDASSNQYNSRARDAQTQHSSSSSNRYNAARSSASQSRYQSNYDSQYRGDSNTNANTYAQSGYNSHLNHGASSDSLTAQSQRNSESGYHGAGYTAGSQQDLNSQVENLNTQPKSYQSSYSYHKSWERQGDPYVIKPASNGYYDGQSSQRLSSTKNNGFAAYQSGSHYNQEDCDENGHRRVARSYNTDAVENVGQQSQGNWDQQNVGQQSQNQWDNLEDLGQQSQSNWDQQNVGQQSQSQWDNLDNLNQQSQSTLDQQNVGQQSQGQWDNLEDLSQQSQSNLDQQNVGQQSQSTWDNLEDLRQQSQSNLEQQNVGQQSQGQWDNLESLNQQSQSNLDQQNVGQQSQSSWDKLADLNQQSQSNLDQQNAGQQSQSSWDKLENLDQQSQSNLDQQNVGQQSQSSWDKLENLDQQSQSNLDQQNVGQQSQSSWDKLENLDQKSQRSQDDQDGDGQLTQSTEVHQLEENRPDNYFQQFQPNNENEHSHNFQTQSNNENHTENDQFYWHQIDNSENNDQQHSDTFSQQDSHLNKEQGQEAIYNIGQNTENNWNQFPTQDLNRPQQGNWQETTTTAQVHDVSSNSRGQGLSGLWAKFDNIDKKSAHDTGNYRSHNQTYATESNSTLLISHENNKTSTLEYQTTLPTIPKDITNNLDKSKETNTSVSREYESERQNDYQPVVPPKYEEPSSVNHPETPQDIGRGDIGPEDLTTHVSDKPYNKHSDNSQNTEHNNAQNNVSHNNNKDLTNQQKTETASDDQLSVLSIQHNTHKENHIINSTESNKEVNVVNSQGKVQNDSHNVGSIETVVNNQEQENVHKTEYENEHHFQQENAHHFEQENVHKTEQGYEHHFQGENVHHFEQENVHHFEQENVHNTEQVNVHNFEPENMHNFHQEYSHNFEQFGQENSQNFHQENMHNYNQDNIHNFNQENLHNFNQENLHNFNQENLHNYHQENMHNFEQSNTENFNQGNMQNSEQSNMHNFNQENLQNFNQQNENMEQQNVHDFGQEFLVEPNENPQQQNLHTFDQVQGFDVGQQSRPDFPQENSNDFQQENIDKGQYDQQFSQEINIPLEQETRQQDRVNVHELRQVTTRVPTTPPAEVQKKFHNLEIPPQPILETREHNSTILEPVTEKPGFWRSVSNKVSNAKDSVVSWFKSF